jgi:hypothetical protein
MTVLHNRVRGLLTDTVLTRLRRESRDARKTRYSARHRALSTKSVINHAISIIFFCSVRKNHYEMIHSHVFAAPQVKNVFLNRNESRRLQLWKKSRMDKTHDSILAEFRPPKFRFHGRIHH